VENTHEVPRIDAGGQIVCAGELQDRDENASDQAYPVQAGIPALKDKLATLPANTSSMRFAAGLRPEPTGEQEGTVRRRSAAAEESAQPKKVPARSMPRCGASIGTT